MPSSGSQSDAYTPVSDSSVSGMVYFNRYPDLGAGGCRKRLLVNISSILYINTRGDPPNQSLFIKNYLILFLHI